MIIFNGGDFYALGVMVRSRTKFKVSCPYKKSYTAFGSFMFEEPSVFMKNFHNLFTGSVDMFKGPVTNHNLDIFNPYSGQKMAIN